MKQEQGGQAPWGLGLLKENKLQLSAISASKGHEIRKKLT